MARGAFTDAHADGHGDFRQVGFVLAGMRPAGSTVEVREPTVTDTDALLAAAGLDAETVATLRAEGAVA